MKILYLTSSVPSLDHEAVERVNYEILKSLLQKKYKIYVQIILQEGENFNYSQDNLKSIFKTNDIFFLEPLTNKIYFKKIFNYLKILLPNKIMMYPSIMHKSKLLKIIKEKKN